MDNEVIISPIEGEGYILEISPETNEEFILEADILITDGYTVVVTDVEGTENLEVISTDEAMSLEVYPQDITGDLIELQPIVHDGYILEIWGGFGGGGIAFPQEFTFSNVNVMNVPHNLYKNIDFRVEKILNATTGEYETVVPDRVTRRDTDMDIFIQPKMNVKVTVYP